MIFENEYVSCSVDIAPDEETITINGIIKVKEHFDKIELFAANPIDRMMNYTGSGLPFPCSRAAFESTPNYYVVSSEKFDGVVFVYPNSYYTEDWKRRVGPSIFFKLSRATSDPVFVRFDLPQRNMLKVRTLTYRDLPRSGPQYYSMKEDVIPICGAEETMRRYADIKIQQDLA